MANKIAKIIIEGQIEKSNETYSQKWLLDTIKKLEDKRNCIGIILYIDSPGGSVFETDEVYKAILKYKKETENPVYAYFGAIAASGGYYMGCSADKIYATRNTLTGSIGVISGHFVDASALLEKYGIKTETIHSGKNKIMGMPTVPFTEEQVNIMQGISDECYEQFVSIVAESRKLDVDKVKELADGRIYTAKQAKEAQLIDDILDFDEVKNLLAKEVFEDEKTKAEVVEYRRKEKKSLLHKITNSTSTTIEPLSSLCSLLGMKMSFPAYYDERFWKR